jgi:hypothetical protein
LVCLLEHRQSRQRKLRSKHPAASLRQSNRKANDIKQRGSDQWRLDGVLQSSARKLATSTTMQEQPFSPFAIRSGLEDCLVASLIRYECGRVSSALSSVDSFGSQLIGCAPVSNVEPDTDPGSGVFVLRCGVCLLIRISLDNRVLISVDDCDRIYTAKQ